MRKFLLTVFLTVATLMVNAQIVHIPDTNFKSYLLGNQAINTDGDDEISVAEASAFTGKIECDSLNIIDLTGIEAFTEIKVLSCGFNQLTSFDISNNTKLTELYCYINRLTSLDVGNNTNLKRLDCGNNQLISLDVSNNINLRSLYCDYNQLTSLDVSNNTNIESLICNNNGLTLLDLSDNINLELLHCYDNKLTSLDVKNGNNTNMMFFLVAGNPNLSCIQVDNADYCNANWTGYLFQKDEIASYSEDCGYVGISDITNLMYSIYPNPSINILNISLASAKDATYTITDVQGRVVKQGVTTGINTGVDISSLVTNIYFITVNQNGSKFTMKFVKE